GERCEIAGAAMHGREHAERGGMPGLGAPQLVREIDRGLTISRRFGLLERFGELAVPRCGGGSGAISSGGLIENNAVGRSCSVGCLVEQARRIDVATDGLVAPRERCARSGNRWIERERLLVVDLRLADVVELLLVDHRQLEV